MKKITKILACLLASVLILAGCSNAEKPVQTSSVAPVSNKQMLVGRWEGKGNFETFEYSNVECNYILNFFQDGTMNISSPSLYFYGFAVTNTAINDGTVEFTIPYTNPELTETFSMSEREQEQFSISFSLKAGEKELTGTTKQGHWADVPIAFAKISDEPRSYQETDTLTVEQMTEDLDVLFDFLEKKHPNIFYRQSEEDYNKRKAELLSKLPTLDKRSFGYEIQRLISSIGDGHTYVGFSQSMGNDSLQFPFRTEYFSGKWHITSIDKQYEQLLGKAVTAVNDVPIEEIMKKVSEFISYENKAGLLRHFRVEYTDVLRYIGIIQGNEATVTIDGKEQVKIALKKVSDIDINSFVSRGKTPETLRQPDKYYGYQVLNDNILYIQYNQCVEMEDYPIAKFVEDIGAEFKKKTYSKIVVDVRYNDGGYRFVNEALLVPLLEAKKQGAKIYCVTGNGTFSGAFEFAFEFKKAGVTLVGQPTGGNMQQFTAIYRFTLPNSRFQGMFSTEFKNFDENAPYDSLYPDVQIDHTIDAYLNGIDEEIEYIKKQK